MLGVEKTLSSAANGEAVFEIKDVTYTNESTSDIQQLAENIFLVDSVQRYGTLEKLVINNVQLRPSEYPKSVTDIFEISAQDDINVDFKDP